MDLPKEVEKKLRKRYGKIPSPLSQLIICMGCNNFVNGYTHTFGKGYSKRCKGNKFMEMYPSDLSTRIPFCYGIIQKNDICHNFYHIDCPIYKKDGGIGTITSFICDNCIHGEKSCLTCPNLVSIEQEICRIHGKLKIYPHDFPDLLYSGGFDHFRLYALKCKDYGNYKPIPKMCENCIENDICLFNFNLGKCLVTVENRLNKNKV